MHRVASNVEPVVGYERDESVEHPFGPLCERMDCTPERRESLEDVVQLAVEIAREGREGRRIGTLFVVGDVDEVLARSRPLLLDPLHGHAPEVLHVSEPGLRETVKELAQLDGAFLVADDGTFVAAGRYVDVDLDPEIFLPGLGARHAAGASITRATRALAVVVSQSAIVRVFVGGEVKAEIIPELFLISKQQLFARAAEIRTLPDAGVTVAMAGAA
jgi:DNA integrity scanning protein DisA with diadenylate cyclase activity